MDRIDSGEIVPFKVVDSSREKRFGVVATSLQDFIIRGETLNLSKVISLLNKLPNSKRLKTLYEPLVRLKTHNKLHRPAFIAKYLKKRYF